MELNRTSIVRMHIYFRYAFCNVQLQEIKAVFKEQSNSLQSFPVPALFHHHRRLCGSSATVSINSERQKSEAKCKNTTRKLSGLLSVYSVSSLSPLFTGI